MIRDFLADKRSVSPVVGTILVMTIAILGISAILFWGIPSINQMKAQSQFDSVLRQFDGIHSTVEKLIHTGAGAAETVTISAASGSVEINKKGDRWIVSYSIKSGYDLIYSGLEDEDNSFTIKNNGTGINSLNVTAQIVQAGEYVNLNVNVTMTNLPGGSSADVSLDRQIEDVVLYVKVSNGTTPISEFFLLDVGYISYSMDSPFGTYRIYETNGGTIVSYPYSNWIRNTPMFWIRNMSGKQTFFLHMVQINGTESVGGTGASYSILLSRTGAAWETAGTLSRKDVSKIRINIYGKNADKWLNWFEKQGLGKEESSVMYNIPAEIWLLRTAFSASITRVIS